MARAKIFISHIASETALAQLLKKHIVRDFLNAVDVYVSSDGKTIQAGSRWLDGLGEALKEAKLEIILCSKLSINRPWVNFEAGAGWIRDIPVIPICHSGMKPNDLPVPLNMLQSVEASQVEGLKQIYFRIADLLQMDVPNTDFDAIAKEIDEVEKKLLADIDVVRIRKPRILCAANKAYANDPKVGFEKDVGILNQYFPGQVSVEHELNTKRLIYLLSKEKFDILHLVLPLNYETGSLIFESRDDLSKTSQSESDIMSSDTFLKLIRKSQVSLITLATCHAHELAIVVSPIANVITTSGTLTAERAAKWGDLFYGMLADRKSLFDAFELADSVCSEVGMRLIRKNDIILDNSN